MREDKVKHDKKKTAPMLYPHHTYHDRSPKAVDDGLSLFRDSYAAQVLGLGFGLRSLDLKTGCILFVSFNKKRYVRKIISYTRCGINRAQREFAAYIFCPSACSATANFKRLAELISFMACFTRTSGSISVIRACRI